MLVKTCEDLSLSRLLEGLVLVLNLISILSDCPKTLLNLPAKVLSIITQINKGFKEEVYTFFLTWALFLGLFVSKFLLRTLDDRHRYWVSMLKPATTKWLYNRVL